MASQTQIREQITNQIIAALESGDVPPWRRPWRLGPNAGGHANVASRWSYRGLNPILLDLASQTHGFSSRW
jgi:antirestriction protein ArdC